MAFSDEEKAALEAMKGAPAKTVVTTARPATGSPNVVLTDDQKTRYLCPRLAKHQCARGRAGRLPSCSASTARGLFQCVL